MNEVSCDECRNKAERDGWSVPPVMCPVLSSSFAISGTPAYNSAIQSAVFLGKGAVLHDEMYTFLTIDSMLEFLIMLLEFLIIE